ncbi:MAG TPA: winged helix-turn-helix domain-containing protein [Thermoanaerobaculia bacterium]|nr:winged helix-turn-helix domain-containing protein [Thermoanaerobaculia bacterium]
MEVEFSSPFGGETRTRLLVALRLLDESYPRELSRLLGVSLSSVQKALRSLELDGLVAVRTMGRTRLAQIDPRYFARRELIAYLGRLAQADRKLAVAAAELRRRPRRTGKPL